MLFRAVFLIAALALTAGTAYVGWFGVGGASLDLDTSPSIRAGSGGAVIGGRVK